jgi:glycosyltransferase involved in cell wall biosynthesis
VRSHNVVLVVGPPPGMHGGVGQMMQYVLTETLRRPYTKFSLSFIPSAGSHRRLFTFAKAVLHVLSATARGRAALAHINVASRGSTVRKVLLGVILALARCPFVIHLHGGQYREFFEARGLLGKHIIRWFFGHAKFVLVLSKQWRTFALEELKVRPDRLVVLPNAVPEPTVRSTHRSLHSREVQLLFLGRLVFTKGIYDLFDALERLPGDLPPWHLSLAGDGELGQVFVKLNQHKYRDRINVLGWCDPGKVLELLRCSDIVVLPSHAEGMPLSVLEGFAHGATIVATPVGGLKDILLDRVNALVVPVGAADTLAATLAEAVRDDSLRARLGASALETWGRDHDITQYVDQLFDVYNRVLSECDVRRKPELPLPRPRN